MNWTTQAVEFGNRIWELSTARVMYQRDLNILVLSDVHLGKSAHFRRHGLQIPNVLHHEDLKKLQQLLAHYQPTECIIVGDIVHAAPNHEWDDFKKLRDYYPNIKFILVQGNHDARVSQIQDKLGIDIITSIYLKDAYIFIHDIKGIEIVPSKCYISGHIHPGISVKMPFRKYMKFPCFVHLPNHMILPAFCAFTGLDTISIKQKAHFYAFHPDGFFSVQS